MKPSLVLLPNPRKIELTDQKLRLENQRVILLASQPAGDLLFSAQRFQSALRRAANIDWQICAGGAIPISMIGLTFEIDKDCSTGSQGYELQIDPGGMKIRSAGQAGIFYGVCTLIQILDQSRGELPCLSIDDAPDFLARGVMLDISRNKVPTMATLFELIDRLASWKINQLQLYTEHTFAYLNHPTVWKDASPVTAQEALELDAYCRQRYIELVPNQNSFGHLTRWLQLPDYAPLAETHDEFDAPWGKVQGPFSLSPANPGSLQMVQSLYDELLPNFSSRMVNVGCDETFDIGVGQSRETCAALGVDRVMFDYLMKLYQEVKLRGLTMQFWADILVHHPNLLVEMPRDSIALIWNYEANQSFEEDSAAFSQAGMPFYVCPGTSSWNSLTGRHSNMLANTLSAALAGRAHGARGYLNTDWGDNGHWQVMPVSLPGFAAGAAFNWSVDANRDAPFEQIVSRFAFDDPSGISGHVMERLGNVYLETGLELPNSSALFWLLQYPLDVLRSLGQISTERLNACQQVVEEAASALEGAKITRPDEALVRREIALSARMLRHACRRGQLLNEKNLTAQSRTVRELKADIAEWLDEYCQIWLARNRPGGLKDSLTRLERLCEEYRRLDG